MIYFVIITTIFHVYNSFFIIFKNAFLGLFLLVGIILFGVKVEVRVELLNVGHVQYKGYSFGLVATAAILMLISAALSAWSGCSEASSKFKQ